MNHYLFRSLVVLACAMAATACAGETESANVDADVDVDVVMPGVEIECASCLLKIDEVVGEQKSSSPSPLIRFR
jgi:hypothetical protein